VESVTSLIPASSARSKEDRLLIAKVMRHIADYLKAVKTFGPDFFGIPIESRSILDDSFDVSQAKQRQVRRAERVKTLACGKIAYQYLFIENGNDVGFMPVCETLGFNAAVFRHKLKNISKKDAYKLYTHFLRGEAKVDHIKRGSK